MAPDCLTVIEEERDQQGNLKKVTGRIGRYVESDTALVNRVLGREVGGKQNILVMNDEAHHAYRIGGRNRTDEREDFRRRGGRRNSSRRQRSGWTAWIASISCAASTSVSIFRPRRTSSAGSGRTRTGHFPWVVSDFGLIDAIESGLVKIPQLAVRDTTGAEIPGYFNIWHWILPQLTPAERGGQEGSPKPEAILKYAHHPHCHAGRPVGEGTRGVGEGRHRSAAAGLHPGLQEHADCEGDLRVAGRRQDAPTGIPPSKIEGFRNTNGRINTIRVDSKVVHETDTGRGKERRVSLDALHAGHGRQDCVAR